MKLIVAGSREITDMETVVSAIEESGWWEEATEIVTGGAAGVDQLAEKYARSQDKPVKTFPASWSQYGRSAGAIRNAEMARYGDRLIAIWDSRSKGTLDMIRKAAREELPTFIWSQT